MPIGSGMGEAFPEALRRFGRTVSNGVARKWKSDLAKVQSSTYFPAPFFRDDATGGAFVASAGRLT